MLAGAVNATDTLPLPGVTTSPDGAPGTVRGVTLTGTDAAPAPAAFTARTRTRYDVPFTSPDTTSGLAVDAGLRATHGPHDAPPFDDHANS